MWINNIITHPHPPTYEILIYYISLRIYTFLEYIAYNKIGKMKSCNDVTHAYVRKTNTRGLILNNSTNQEGDH